MEKYLAIDSSARHLTVIANGEKNTAVRYIPDCALRHSVAIMGEIQAAMEEVSLLPEDCDFFCAVTGPGSFTGIRIGISAAKGFAVGAGKPLMPLTAFEMVAYNVKDKDFCAAVDAAHGHFYCQRFLQGKACEPEYISREQLLSYNLPIYGYEEQNMPYYTQINADSALKNAVECKLKTAEPFGAMNALYVRKSQAEEGRQ